MEKYLRKWLKTMIYFGDQNASEIGPLRLIFNISLNAAQIGRYTKTDAKPVENFEKITKDQNFYLYLGPTWPTKRASEAHILQISYSTYNEHVKQYWCETSANLLR